MTDPRDERLRVQGEMIQVWSVLIDSLTEDNAALRRERDDWKASATAQADLSVERLNRAVDAETRVASLVEARWAIRALMDERDGGLPMTRAEVDRARLALAPRSERREGEPVRVAGLYGSALICKCGSGAVDVAPDFYIDERTAVSWTCANGHKQISGWRPGAPAAPKAPERGA